MVAIRQATLVLALVGKTIALLRTKRNHDIANFDTFIAEYKRSYVPGSSEYEDRRKLFESRIEKVRTHNSKPARLWNAVINHLSDRTERELVALRGLRPMRAVEKSGAVQPHRQKGHFLHQVKNDVFPEEVSWTNLTSVRKDTDQASCGSCWAVATATMLSANAEIKGYRKDFSAQELVDCVPNPHKCGGTGGCEGSTVELALNWFTENGLADTQVTPYLGQDGRCKKAARPIASLLSGSGDESLDAMIRVGFHAPLSAHSAGVALGLRGWERLAENEYEPLMAAVAFTGPVAVSVAADQWNQYGSGIFDDCGRNAVVDHAVTLVGYGVDATRNNKPFWRIKNSWGSSWGEDGFIRILRHVGESYCGTDYQPELGTGCQGGPTSVKVCGMCGILYDSVVAHFNPAP